MEKRKGRAGAGKSPSSPAVSVTSSLSSSLDISRNQRGGTPNPNPLHPRRRRQPCGSSVLGVLHRSLLSRFLRWAISRRFSAPSKNSSLRCVRSVLFRVSHSRVLPLRCHVCGCKRSFFFRECIFFFGS